MGSLEDPKVSRSKYWMWNDNLIGIRQESWVSSKTILFIFQQIFQPITLQSSEIFTAELCGNWLKNVRISITGSYFIDVSFCNQRNSLKLLWDIFYLRIHKLLLIASFHPAFQTWIFVSFLEEFRCHLKKILTGKMDCTYLIGVYQILQLEIYRKLWFIFHIIWWYHIIILFHSLVSDQQT